MKVENRQISSCTHEADAELLRRFQNGDETAFVELLAIHSGYVRYWVGLALKHASWANADDLRQEAHLGFFEAAKKYRFTTKGNFHALARIRAWGKMFDSPEVRIVNRTLYDNHREVVSAQDRLMERLGRGPSLDELALEANLTIRQAETALNVLVFPSALEENDGSLVSEDSETLELLSDAIAQLSPDQADVMTRRYAGEKFSEIARAMSRSEDAVKKLHERAKKNLRRIIQGEGIKEDAT